MSVLVYTWGMCELTPWFGAAIFCMGRGKIEPFFPESMVKHFPCGVQCFQDFAPNTSLRGCLSSGFVKIELC